jgi:putative resolvase
MTKREQKRLRVGAVAHALGLHPITVRRWIQAGRIQAVPIGREVRVPRAEIEQLVGKLDERLLVLYGRVSGHGQKVDLDIQLERLQAWAKTERKDVETLVLCDIGSGLKASRRQLQRPPKLVCEDKVGEIAITYEDRLTRFGQEYLQTLFACFDVTLTVLEPGEEKTPEQELTHDLLALIASFSGRLYGMREVPAKYVSPLERERRVVGFDWGVRSLITVSILEKGDADVLYQQVSRPVFLDTGGIDGRQARLRREIDRLKACRDRYAQLIKQALAPREEHGIPLPAHVAGWQRRVKDYETRIKQCWKTYERRNLELAHLASNLLILLALLYDCRLICGENLATLKTEDVVVGCVDGFGTGTTIPQCEVSYGASSHTSAICWASVRARWNHVEKRIPAHTAISQLKPMRPQLQPTTKKPLRGGRGSAVQILSVCGTGRGITRHL